MTKADLTIIGDSLPDRTLAYLASPYSEYPDGLEIAFREIARIAGQLMLAGITVISPIVHSHPISIHSDVDALDWEFHLQHDETIMARCDVLIVTQMKSWQESKGIDREIGFFTKHKRTIFLLNPVSMTLRRMVRPASELVA